MTKEFLTYELTLKLKEVGFNEPCMGYYDCERDLKLVPNKNKFLSCEYAAPLYQQVFKWFREKYGLEGVIQKAEDFTWYKWKINQYNENGKKQVSGCYEYKTYEESDLACLNKLIEIVKQQTTLNNGK